MVIVLSSTDELLIQAHEYSRTPHLSFVDSRSLTILSLRSRSLLYKEVALVKLQADEVEY